MRFSLFVFHTCIFFNEALEVTSLAPLAIILPVSVPTILEYGHFGGRFAVHEASTICNIAK